MKPILFLPLAALLAASCNKSEEKPADPVSAAPKAGNRLSPTSAPPGGASAPAAAPKPQVPPPSPAEIAALQQDLESIAKSVDDLGKAPDEEKYGAEFERVEKEYRVLTQRRSALMAGMTIDQKREMAKQFGPMMQRINAPLTQMRIARSTAQAAARRAAAHAKALENAPAPAAADAAGNPPAAPDAPPAADAPPAPDAPPADPAPADAPPK